jgi:tRNA dimethylallyltransferase
MNFLIVIGGPTAAGKTSLAINLAHQFDAEIISADSRQFYREMTIGTAKPSQQELDSVTHHFIDSLSIHETYDISQFEHDTMKLLEQKFKEHSTMIMVGGSGLYHEAVIHGLDDLPPKSDTIRAALQLQLNEAGLTSLQEELKKRDPDTAQRIDLNNPLRVVRALEICRITEQPYSSFLGKKKNKRQFTPLLIAVAPERTSLYERINQRVDQMIAEGLVNEARSLLSFRQLHALHTVGYSELFDHFDDKYSLEEAIEKIKQHTRNYAKRQMTWFRNQSNYTIFHPENIAGITDWIRSKITS